MSDRLRITLADVPLTIQPALEELQRIRPAGKGESVRQLPRSAEDRAQGRTRLEVAVGGWLFEATVESAARAELRDRVVSSAAAHHVGAEVTLVAPIPGRIVRLWVAPGDQVEAGQRLLAIEAMKMENEIRAPRGGMIRDVRVEVGVLVERQFELLTIE